MNDPAPQRVRSQIDQRRIRVGEVVERPPAKRPKRASVKSIAEWLVGPAAKIESGAYAVDEYAWRLLAAGLPVLRVTLHSGTLHPQFLGVSFIWWRDTGQTVQTLVAHEIRDEVPYAENAVLRVIEGGETIRRRLDVADSELDLPILPDLKARGGTEYIALPIASAQGNGYAVTYTTDRVGGFSEREIADVTRLSRRMRAVCDSYRQRGLTRNLLNAYLGGNAGPKVLAGQIRRGTGEELTAVLWSSDLRGFTARSDRLAGDRMIAILNALFDAQATAIHNHGGEILKFVGDGLLAIFPIDDVAQPGYEAENAIEAAREALAAVRNLASDGNMVDEPPLEIVVALHVGTVIYGNVGSAERLDFTAIGPAVNLVSRLEAVAKALGQAIVVSDDFARAYKRPLRSLGHHDLRGLAKARELFTLHNRALPG